jgi:hypothetical protein
MCFMKTLIVSCLAACVLASVVGCSCDKSCKNNSQPAPMAKDTKDMKPVQK